MLTADQRLRDGDSFRRVMRRGRKASTARLAVHVLTAEPAAAGAPSRAGLVVSRAVGNAVVRNRVKRRLRHLLRPMLTRLPAGTGVVVRAFPPAAAATSAELRRDLDRSLSRAIPEERSGMQASQTSSQMTAPS